MSMPFYVPAEQMMKDQADYARKGIARGRGLAALFYADGILICAENPSSTLRKVSEIYDRIAFAGVGKYNEFDQLRIAGVRHADLKGYSFSREDVDARSLANAVRPDARARLHPRDEADGGRDPGGRGGRRRRRRPAVPHPLRRHGRRRGRLHRARRRRRGHRRRGSRRPTNRGWRSTRALRAAVAALAGPDRTLAAVRARGRPSSTRDNGRRAFRRLSDEVTSGALAGGDATVEAAPEAPSPAEATAGVPEPSAEAPLGPTASRRRPARRVRRGRLNVRPSLPRNSTRPSVKRTTSTRPTTRISVRTRPTGSVRAASTSRPSVGVDAGLVVDDGHRIGVGARHHGAGQLQVVGGHQHLHRAHGVGAVHVAAELPHDALGTQVGGENAGRERVGGGRQRHHGADGHPRDGTRTLSARR